MIEKKEVGVGFRLLAGMLVLIVAIALTGVIGMVAIRQVFTREGIRSVLDSSLSLESEFEGFNYEISDFMSKEWGINKEEMEMSAEDFWPEVTSGILLYAITGEGEPIDVEQAVKIIQKYEKEIEEASGMDITTADYDELRLTLQLVSDKIKDSVDFENMENGLVILRDIANAKYLMVPVGAAVLGIMFIFMIFSEFLGKAFTRIGFSGCLASSMSGLLYLMVNVIGEGITGEFDFFEALFFSLKRGLGVGAIIALVIGLCMMVIGFKMQSNKEN